MMLRKCAARMKCYTYTWVKKNRDGRLAETVRARYLTPSLCVCSICLAKNGWLKPVAVADSTVSPSSLYLPFPLKAKMKYAWRVVWIFESNSLKPFIVCRTFFRRTEIDCMRNFITTRLLSFLIYFFNVFFTPFAVRKLSETVGRVGTKKYHLLSRFMLDMWRTNFSPLSNGYMPAATYEIQLLMMTENPHCRQQHTIRKKSWILSMTLKCYTSTPHAGSI